MAIGIIQRTVLPAALVVAGLACAVLLNGAIEDRRPHMAPEYSDSDLNMNASHLSGFLFGAEGLLADWYYLRGLLYIGDKVLSRPEGTVNIDDLRSLDPRLLYPLLDNATDLDPHFMAAYAYGAMVLPAIDPEQAIALTKKGIVANPGSWRLYQQLGFVYWRSGRYDEAAAAFEQGATIGGAEPFMKMMAASMRTEGGSRKTARAIYRETVAGTTDPSIQMSAKRRLAELDWYDQRDAINGVLAEFREKNGRCANTFAEIGALLMAIELPDGGTFRVDRSGRLVDPTDAPYLLDKEACRVTPDPNLTGLTYDAIHAK
ncbi:MAG: tetratricopeptide repeat protein [Pyrinomonadaceae bacterium]